MDSYLEDSISDGRFNEEEAREVQTQLIKTGMTLPEVDGNYSEFIDRLAKADQREQDQKAGKSDMEMWLGGLDAGWKSQLVGGAIDGMNELSTFLNETLQFGESFDKSWRAAIALHFMGFKDPEIYRRLKIEGNIFDTIGRFLEVAPEVQPRNMLGNPVERMNLELDLPTTKREEGFVNNAVRGMSQFVTGQVAVNALGGPVGMGGMTFKRGLTEGAVTSATAFNPGDGNLADFLQTLGIDNVVVDYLSTSDKEQESEFEKRIKNGVIDAGFGMAVHWVMAGLKGIKSGVMQFTDEVLMPASKASGLDDESVTALSRPKAEKPEGPVIGESVEETVERTTQQIDEVRPETLITIDDEAFDDFIYMRENIPDEQLTSEAGNPVPWWDNSDELRRQVRQDGGITVQWNYINSTDEAKQAATQMEVAIYERLQKARGKSTWADDAEIAKRLNLMPEQMQKIPGRLKQIRHEIYAGRLLQVSAFERLVDLVNAYDASRSAVDLDAIYRHFTITSSMTEWLAGAKSEGGRLLQSLQMPVQSSSAGMAKLQTYINSYGGQEGIDTLISLVRGINRDRKHGPAGRWLDVLDAWGREFMKGLNWTKELVVDTAIMGMISSTITLGRNIFGNTYMVADKISRTAFSEVVSPVVGGSTEKYETAHMIYGALKVLPDAVLRSTIAMITDKPQSKLFRSEFYKSSLEGNLNVSGDMLISDGLRFLNKSIYLPGRVNMTQDEFFRSLNLGMERERLAHRYALRASNDGILPYRQAKNDLLSKNPESPMRIHYHDMSKKMASEASDQIFATPVGTKPSWFNVGGGKQLSVWLNELRNEPTGIGRLMFPFYGTVINIDRNALARIPGANLLIKESVDNILGRSGRDAQIDAIGKLFVGTGIATYAWEMMESDEMTAGFPPPLEADDNPIQHPYFIPSRKYLQDSSWRPYALVSEEGYRSLRGLDPVAMMMQLGADSWVMHKILTDGNLGGGLFRTDSEAIASTDAWLEMLKYFTIAAGTKIDERPFLKGLSDTLALFSEDDLRHKAVLSNLISSVNPLNSYYGALRAAWARSEDAYQRDSKAHDAIDQAVLNWQRRNPWLTDFTGSGGSTKLNPRVNFMGDPQLIYAVTHWLGEKESRAAQAFLNIASVSPIDKNPLMEKIREIGGVKTDFPSRWVAIQVPAEDGTKREDLTQEQQYAWVMEAAKLNRASFKSMFKKDKEGNWSSPQLDGLPAEQQREFIDGLLGKNRIISRDIVLRTHPSWEPIVEQYPQLIKERALGEISDKRPASYYKTQYEWLESKTTKGSNTNPVLEQISE